MKPVDFKGSNKVYEKPEHMTDEECGSLPVNQTGDVIVSCWELDEHDIEAVIKSKRVWLGVVSYVQPPVFIMAEEPYQVSKTKISKDAEEQIESNNVN